MAESKGARRYGSPPKIKEKPGDVNRSVSEQDASGKAKSTASGKVAEVNQHEDPGPEASVTTGTDGIPVHERHAGDRDAMTGRHNKERSQMNKRHETEYSDMAKAHTEEMSRMVNA